MTNKIKSIHPDELIPMDLCSKYFPLSIHLAYKDDKAPNIFGKIYGDQARLWLHRDLAIITCLAAKLCYEKTGYSFVLYDGLRTSDAQAKMAQSDIVKANPGWMVEPRLLSPPGAGAHPRAMAIDVSLKDKSGTLIDMGTEFDFLAQEQGMNKNPAHRAYKNMKPEHAKNRQILTLAMIEASELLGMDLLPYSEEWWDFRFKKEVYEQFAPLSDSDLPPEMQMVNTVTADDFNDKYEPRVKDLISDIQKLSDIAPIITSPEAG